MTTSQLIAAASLLLALGAHAADDSSNTQPVSAAASAAPAAAAPAVVCGREMLVGSRIPTRVCRTVDPQGDDRQREETRRLIHQGAPAAAQGINGKGGG